MEDARRNTGFTLIELMISIVVIWILFGIATPNFTRLYQKNIADAVQESIYYTFQTARSLAISEQKHITICGSNTGTVCERYWSEYIIIFEDTDNDHIPNTNEIRQLKSISAKGVIKTRIALGRNYTRLNTHGRPSYTGSMLICPEANDPSMYRRITWNQVGRAYRGRDLDDDGIIEDTNGEPISCER